MSAGFDPYHTWLGIPPEEQPADHYRLLGVKRFETNPDVIANASDQRMSHLRTFQNGKRATESQQLLNELAAATRCLLDPAQRPAYDQKLKAKLQANKPAPALVKAKPLPAAPANGETNLANAVAAASSGIRSATPTHPHATTAPLPVAMTVAQPAPVIAAPVIAAPTVELAKAGPPRKSGGGSPVVLIGGIAVALVMVVGSLGVAWMLTNGQKKAEVAVQPAPSPVSPAPGEPAEPTKPPEKSTEKKPAAIPPPTETSQPAESSSAPERPATAQSGGDSDQPGTTAPPRTAPSTSAPTSPAVVTPAATGSRFPYQVGDAWSYYAHYQGETGIIRKTSDNSWTDQRTTGKTVSLREINGNNGYVDLLDEEQRDLYRVFDDRMMHKKEDAPMWSLAANGNWVAKLAMLPSPPQNVPAGPATDLLATDWSTQTVSGGFTGDGMKSSLGGARPDQVEFQTPVPEQYLLAAELMVRGPNHVRFHLPYGGRQVDLVFNLRSGDQVWSGLELVDGKKLDSGPKPWAFPKAVLEPGKRYRLDVLVMRHSIRVQVDGRLILNWLGHPSQVAPHPWTYLADQHHLGFTAWNEKVDLYSLLLRPISGGIPWQQPLPTPKMVLRVPASLTRATLPAIEGESLTAPPPPMGNSVAGSDPSQESAPTRIVGRFRKGSRVEVNHDAQLIDPQQPFTAEMWFLVSKVTGPQVLWDFDRCRLAITGEADEAGRLPMAMTVDGQEANFNGPALANAWRHVALAGDGRRMQLYLNGQLLHSVSSTNLRQPWRALTLGGSRDGSLEFEGEILEFRLSKTKRYEVAPPWKPTSVPLDADTRWLLTFDNGNQVRLQENGRDSSLHHLWRNLYFDRRPIRVPLPPSTPTRSTMPEVAKEEPPQGEALTEAKAKVAEAYKDKLKAATKGEDKLKLAKELLDLSRAEPKSEVCFAILAEARTLAIAAPSVDVSLDVINELDRRFKVERGAVVLKVLTELNAKALTPDDREALVDEAALLAQACIAKERYDLAETSAQLAFTAVNRGKDAEKKKAIKTVRDRTLVLKKNWDTAETAKETLKSAPDDAAANLVVGKYHACLRGDFTTALPYLAKGSDEKLASAAQAEAAAKTNAERLAVADAWRTAVDGQKPDDKLALQRHALELYKQLVTALSGLDQATADKRVKELEPIVADADKANPLAFRSTRVSTRPVSGLILRVLVHDPSNSNATPVPTPYILVYHEQQDVLRARLSDVLREYGSHSRAYVATGQINLEKDCNVEFDLGPASCKVGNQTVGVGTYNQPLRTALPMKKGSYPVLITTKDYSPMLRIVQQDTGASVLFHTEKELQAELDKSVPSPRGGTVKGTRVDK